MTMQATYVAPAVTALSFDEAASSVLAALQATGEKISRQCHATALAKTALETGRWQHIYNYNYGNVKAATSYIGMYTCIKLNEVLKRDGKDTVVWFAPEGELTGRNGHLIGAPVQVPEGHPQTRMRVHANSVDGAYEYVEFVSSRRYLDAWEELLVGDPVGYVAALHQAGYFTADPVPYTKAVVSLYGEFLNRLGGRAAPLTPVPDPSDVRTWLTPQQWNSQAVLLDAAFAAREIQIVEDNFKDDFKEDPDQGSNPEGIA
jgi:hypothetical protein